MKKAWRWVLTAALALAFVAGATAKAGGDLVLEETHAISRGATLSLESGRGSVIITGEDRDDVHIEVRAEDLDVDELKEMLDLEVREISGGLEVTVDIEERRSFFSLGRSRGRIWVDVFVPRATSLSIDNGSGGVSVLGIDGHVMVDNGSGGVKLETITGDVDIDNGSGGVSIEAVRGDLTVDNGSGGIKVSDVQGDVSIDNNSGGVKVMEVEGRLEIDNGSGGIKAVLSGRNRGIEVESGSGGVTLEIPSGWGADLDLRSSSSSITIRGFSDVELDDADEFRGSVGGGGPPIHVRSGSGQVMVIAG